jgi:YD repeat-containing protein
MAASKSFPALVVLVCALGGSAVTGTDRDRNGLKGAVKSVVTEAADYGGASGNCSEGKRTVIGRAQYNADGGLIESTQYQADGSVFRREVCSYDSSGGRKTQTSYDSGGLLVEKQFFDLNNNGRLINVESYAKDGSLNSTANWHYNAQGQRIGFEAHDSKGNLTRSGSFNPAGLVTESDDYQNGVLVGKQVLNYDANGYLLEFLRYGNGRSPIDGLTQPIRTVNSYDSVGRLLEKKEFGADGSLMWKQTFTFDKNRMEVDHTVHDQAGSLKSHTTYAYEYDSAGNWTVQRVSEEGSNKTCSHPLRVQYRTITYY